MITYTPVAIRYGETDMMGIVYHANYFLYFEDARTHFLREAGMPYSEIEAAGYMCPVYRAEIDYAMPLRYGQRAIVETRVVKNAPTKTVYEQRVFLEDDDPQTAKPHVKAFITACTVDRETFKPVSIKRELPYLYEGYNKLVEPEV